MQQSQFLNLQEIVRAVTGSESRRECRRVLDRARSEMAEIRAATRKTIIESRELMAEADAVIARRERLRNAPLSALFISTGLGGDRPRDIGQTVALPNGHANE